MQEEEGTQGVTIERCPNCRAVVTPKGIRWSCDDWHPEVLAWLQAQGRLSTPGKREEEDSSELPDQSRKLRP